MQGQHLVSNKTAAGPQILNLQMRLTKLGRTVRKYKKNDPTRMTNKQIHEISCQVLNCPKVSKAFQSNTQNSMPSLPVRHLFQLVSKSINLRNPSPLPLLLGKAVRPESGIHELNHFLRVIELMSAEEGCLLGETLINVFMTSASSHHQKLYK